MKLAKNEVLLGLAAFFMSSIAFADTSPFQTVCDRLSDSLRYVTVMYSDKSDDGLKWHKCIFLADHLEFEALSTVSQLDNACKADGYSTLRMFVGDGLVPVSSKAALSLECFK